MSSASIILRGRSFSGNDLDFIGKTVTRYYNEGRSFISRIICEELKWQQPNGWLKDRACRDVLLQLEARNVITLPPRKAKKDPYFRKECEKDVEEKKYELIDDGDINQVRLIMIRHTKYEKEWNHFVSMHHYLGHKVIVGRHLKYMAFLNDIPVACLGWGEAAWAVNCRDEWIGWTEQQRKQNIHLIINNVRFLILPWVRLPNLASKILGQSAKIIEEDWRNFYQSSPLLLETFVEQNRFLGTCYKAANWIDIGTTRGTSKKGNTHFIHKNIKKVFVYPLARKYRESLIFPNKTECRMLKD